MIKLRKFMIDDYEELVSMLYGCYSEVYSDTRKIGNKYFYYKTVMDWISSKKDIIVSCSNDEITGFSMAYTDDVGGLTEPIYYGEICYVKEKYRGGRSAYLLYKNVSQYAEERQITLVANGRYENNVTKLIEKHFKPKTMFINYERKR